ncbi:MAG: 2Fe-2S iron-sulfur cluster-binding protein [Pseudorhodoplanes sp.]
MSGVDISVRIARIETVAERIKRVRLVPAVGGTLPTFSAGAHIVVTLRDGERTIRNPYSLMGSPSDNTGYEISVLKTNNAHGGSRLIHEKLHEGAVISISHPSNHFALDLRARKHLLIAGGIGITPTMAMAEQLFNIGAAYEMHYSTRTLHSGAYVDQLKRRHGRRIHHYQTASSPRMDMATLLSQQPLGTHLYVCGPDKMIHDVLRIAKEAGWPSQHLHAEHFTAPRGGIPFDVVLARTRRTVRVEVDESILQALESAGLEPPYLCRGGACGQCETAVVSCEGSILHYDHYLTEEEKQAGQKIMLCVSRLKGSRITLDL